MVDVLGDDTGNNLFGTSGNDRYFGFGGFDLLFASLGNDILDGGTDTDVAIYDGGLFTNGVFINNTDTAIGTVMAFSVDKRGFGTDLLVDVSNFHGSNFDDTIYIGGNGDTYSFDRAGDDLVVASQDPNAIENHNFLAGSGNDTYIGTVLSDVVTYRDPEFDGAGPVTQGVDVDLQSGVATDGWGDTDTLIGIERVRGTRFDDILRGDDGRNDFVGFEGDDFFDGRGGDDDRVRYDQFDPSGIDADLASGIVIDGWGDTDTLVNIERVTGSQHADVIRGDENDNVLVGKGGADLLEGRGGNDFFEGGAGNDTIDGGAGDRDRVSYSGEDASDAVTVDLEAGTATDRFGDTDTLISIERVTGTDGNDTILGDEKDNDLEGRAGDDIIRGRGGDDFIEGDEGDDQLFGDAGRDDFRPGQGNDLVDGGSQPNDFNGDRVRYDREHEDGGTQGIVADLAAGTATDTFGDTDTLVDIEEVIGSIFDDTISGNDADNYIEGGGGDDTLSGGVGNDSFRGSEGNDTIDGGASDAQFSGGDRVSYDEEHERGGTAGIDANLTTGIVTDTFGNTDTLTSIEEIRGSVFDDTILGSGANEFLDGDQGNDLIDAIGGNNNSLKGGDGDDTLLGSDVGGDFITPGDGEDTIDGRGNSELGNVDTLNYHDRSQNGEGPGVTVTLTSEFGGTVVDLAGDTDTFANIERVRGSNFDDTFIGGSGDQSFEGMGGNDTFIGGEGDRDQLDYRADTRDPAQFRGIEIDLAEGTAIDRYGDTDTFSGIERVRGSQFDDDIRGDDQRNELRGDDGDDFIDSVGGVDNYLQGGRGNDTLNARGDNDFVDGGDGNDLIAFFGEGGGVNPGLGSDTIIGGTEGFFSINYSGVGADLIIDTAAGTTQFSGSTDVDNFTNIRNTEGGDGNDTLLGDDLEEFQRFRTSLGDDFIDGRGGFDLIEYDDDRETSVVVDFINGTVTGAFAGTDTFVNIEEARGSDGDDTFIGNDEDNRFRGMDGVDDFDGNGGFDSISFSSDRSNGGMLGVTVDLGAGTNTDGWGNSETNSQIERVVATDFADTLLGSNLDDRLIGIEGDDVLDGRDGEDGLYAGGGADTVTGGAGADAFGGRIWELDGDTFTDFSAEDRLQVFDDDFNLLAADVIIVGDQMRIDTTGDGVADAVVTLTNGFTGPVTVEGGPVTPPEGTVFSVEDAGVFTTVVGEGDVVANVTITRTGDLDTTARVDVTMTGTGLNPVEANDVTTPFGVPITLTFAPGQDQLIYQIGIVDDLDVESFEDLVFSLSNPTTEGLGGAQIEGASTFVRVLNNDVGASVRVDGEKRNEDAGEISFTVSRTGDLSEALIVPYEVTSAGGIQGAEADDLVDGLPQSGTVTIPAGSSSTSFSIPVVVDDMAELHDDIIATISSTAEWPDGLTVSVAQASSSIRNDDGVPPVLPVGATGSNFGDPHIVTLDGLAYDFQAVGEFTLIEATSGDPLGVQVRFQPVEGSQVASQTTAVATLLGTSRVVVDVDGSSLVAVDGVAFDLADAVGGAAIGDGDIYFDGEAITLVYANGEQLRIDLFDGFLSTSISIGEGRDVRGLLGDADGDPANDLALPDGTVLAQPVSFDDLYGAYAGGWRIDDASSLFDYAPGEGTADFSDLSFPAAGLSLEDFPLEVIAAAEAALAGIDDPVLRDAALLDYLVSGNTSYIEAAAAVDEFQDEMVVELIPEDAPPILSGIGISASVAELVEGDSGTQTVGFTIYRTGDLSDAVAIEYAAQGTVDAMDYSGADVGTLSFAAGEASKLIMLGVTGDETVEENETLEVAFTLVGEAPPTVISSTARVTIINDDLAPPEPELNLLVGTDQSDRLRGTDGDDLIIGKGGRYDRLIGDEGADVFVFGEETRNGTRERDLIRDYEVGVDSILLTDGAEIGQVRDTRKGVVIFFEEDRDALYIRGEDVSSDTITIIYDDVFSA